MMKTVSKILFIIMLGALLACSNSEKPLYDQVMDIHDEVMPKMNDLYKLKKHLKDSIASTPDMPGEQKEKFEQTILLLDSAGNSMMVWMREFNPPDQKDTEAFQKYMEAELVKVTEMKAYVLSAIDKAQN